MRLTKTIKYKLLNAIVDQALDKDRRFREDIQNSLALLVYADNYSPDTILKMDALPENFFGKTKLVQWQVDNNRLSGFLPEERKFAKAHYQSPIKNYDLKEPLDKRIVMESLRLLEITNALEINRCYVYANAKKILDSVSTDHQLAALWPEIIELIPKTVSEAITVPNKLKTLLSLKKD